MQVREDFSDFSNCGSISYHQYSTGLLSEKINSYKLAGTLSNVTSEYFKKVRTFTGVTTAFWPWKNVNVNSLSLFFFP